MNIKNNENSNKINNYLLNISKISRIHKKGLSYNFDFRETTLKEIPKLSKEINPVNNVLKDKKVKNNRNKQAQNNIEMNKIKKINTIFNTNNNKEKTKSIYSKIYENCLNKEEKGKNKSNIALKAPKTIITQKKQKTKNELNTKKNNKKIKSNIKNNKANSVNEFDLKKDILNSGKKILRKKIF